MSNITSFEPIWPGWIIDEEIGHGSFGRVYKAHSVQEDGTTVYAAVKHIPIPSKSTEDDLLIDTPETRRRLETQLVMLQREIDTMKEMKGRPNLVTYQDHVSIPRKNGVGYDVFLRMELLTSLKDWGRKTGRKNLDLADILDLGVHMCTALILMEQRKYIHRDIKPANVFIDEKTRQFKLGDFGTARVLSSEGNAATVTGTPNYMAPEVYRNRPPYDQTVDIYSLGVMLYRYLNNGLFPFATPESPNADSALAIRMQGNLPIPKPVAADDELAAIVMKCIAFNPAERYQTAQNLFRDLGSYRAKWRRSNPGAVPVPSRPEGPMYTMGTATPTNRSGQPMPGMPMQGNPVNNNSGNPMPNMPMQGAPVNNRSGNPMGNMPMQGNPMGNMPVQGNPMGNVPVQGNPMGNMPVQGNPVNNRSGNPMGNVPMQGNPTGSRSVDPVVQGVPSGSPVPQPYTNTGSMPPVQPVAAAPYGAYANAPAATAPGAGSAVSSGIDLPYGEDAAQKPGALQPVKPAAKKSHFNLILFIIILLVILGTLGFCFRDSIPFLSGSNASGSAVTDSLKDSVRDVISSIHLSA